MAEKVPSEDKNAVEDESSSESDKGKDLSSKTDLSDRTEDKSAIEDVERNSESDKGEDRSRTDLSDRTEGKSDIEGVERNSESDKGEDRSSRTDLSDRTEGKSAIEDVERNSESDKGEDRCSRTEDQSAVEYQESSNESDKRDLSSRTELSNRTESEVYSQTDSKKSEETVDVLSNPQEESRMFDELADKFELLSVLGNLKDDLKEMIGRIISRKDEVKNNKYEKLDANEKDDISYRLTNNPLMIPAFILSNVRDALERARTWGQTLVPIFSNYTYSIESFMNNIMGEAVRHNAQIRRRRPAGSHITPTKRERHRSDRVLIYNNVHINVPDHAWENVTLYEKSLALAITEYITSNEELYNVICLESEAKQYLDDQCNLQ